MRSNIWGSVAGHSIKLYSWGRQTVNICITQTAVDGNIIQDELVSMTRMR